MAVIRVTKEFDFEMAHALWNYDGACRNIHGHSYRLFVTVKGEPIEDEDNKKFGMVLDFKDLKAVVKNHVVDVYDHALMVYKKAEGAPLSAVKSMYEKILVQEFQPTCENMVIHIAAVLNRELPAHLSLCTVKLYETATSYAEWHNADNT
jgi:6-pyruvoyltetrahydropterin/6-carboxytetrahydropterin synthase